MATAHAGVKRTHHEMNGGAHGREISATSSRTNSPLPAALNGRAEWARADSVSIGLRATRFPLSSSLVLIGLPGAGKSTLGVIAATAYNRRLVEVDKVFAEVVGTPSIAYRKLHGPAEYHRRHAEVLKDTLERYSQDAVIVCGISDLENHGAPLLRNYAATHPVIHVTRDAAGIQSHLQALTIDRLRQLLSASDKLLRSCSNYDFYNLSESTDSSSITSSESAQVTRKSSERGFLTLKSVERDFLALVQKVFHGFDRWLPQRPVEPFANIELASRDRTLALSLGVSDVLGHSIDLDQAQVGVDCIELTIDIDVRNNRQGYHELAQAFAMLRRSTTLPMLINLTSAKRPQMEPKAYLEMAEHCLRLGPELCAIDLALDDQYLAPLIASRGDTKIIGVSEFAQRPPRGWQDDKCFERYQRAQDVKCDMVKITMPARDVEDVFSIHDFRRKTSESADSIPLIAFCSGSAGRTSKCFNTILTPVEPPNLDSASDVSETTDGQLTARLVTKALFSSFALEPLQFFVYGGNVEASLSPAMHNAAYEACGLAYTYQTKSSKSLDEFKRISAGITFGGSAIAQPYKTAVIDLLDGLSPHAKAIGAANTVVPIRDFMEGAQLPDEDKVITQRRRQGPVKALYGFNTDWIGLRACIRRGLSPANTIQAWSSALVCGAGGMARAAVYSLISLGVRNIFVCNRTVSHARNLVEHYNRLASDGLLSQFIPDKETNGPVRLLDSFGSSWPRDIRHPTMIINCIPRRTPAGQSTDFSLPDDWLKSPTGGVVVEVAYDFPVSPLARQIRKAAPKGWIFLDGFDMIPEQAYSQFELLTGRRAPRKLMWNEIMKYYPADAEK